MFLILECSSADHWPPSCHGGTKAIPPNRRPTVLQGDRETAEREAVRLANVHPGCRFVVFEPCAAGILVEVPTHLNYRGEVLQRRTVGSLVRFESPDDVPF